MRGAHFIKQFLRGKTCAEPNRNHVLDEHIERRVGWRAGLNSLSVCGFARGGGFHQFNGLRGHDGYP